MAAFPAAIGILVLAGPIIRVFYGEKWVPAIPLFYVLALYGLVRSIGCTASAVFMSTGRPAFVRRVSLLQLLIAVPLVYPIAREFGTVGVAILFTGAYSVGTVYALGKVRQILGIEVLSYARVVSLPLVAAALAGLTGWIVCLGLGPASWTGVAASGVMLGSVYGTSVYLLDRSMYPELTGLLHRSK